MKKLLLLSMFGLFTVASAMNGANPPAAAAAAVYRTNIDTPNLKIECAITGKTPAAPAKKIYDALNKAYENEATDKGFCQTTVDGISKVLSFTPSTAAYVADQVGKGVINGTCYLAGASWWVAGTTAALAYTAVATPLNWVGTTLDVTPSKAIKTIIVVAVIAAILETLNRYDRLYPVINTPWDNLINGATTAYADTADYYSEGKLTFMQEYLNPLLANLTYAYNQLDTNSPLMVSLGKKAQLLTTNAKAVLDLAKSGNYSHIQADYDGRYNNSMTICKLLKNVTTLCGNGAYDAIIAMCKQNNVTLPEAGIGCSSIIPTYFKS